MSRRFEAAWRGTRREATGSGSRRISGWCAVRSRLAKSCRTSPACLRFPPPPLIFLNDIHIVAHGPCSVPASELGYALWRCGEAGPAPWSTPGPRLFKLWSGRAIRGGSGRGAEGLPGLSARDAGDERRHSNFADGFWRGTGDREYIRTSIARRGDLRRACQFVPCSS